MQKQGDFVNSDLIDGTSLPNGEVSARRALTTFLAKADTSHHRFDWRTLVERMRPGENDPWQQEQKIRVERAIKELYDWTGRMGIPYRHQEASALFGVCSSPNEAPWPDIMLLVKYIYWVYAFDSFTDDPQYTNLTETTSQQAQDRMSRYLAHMFHRVLQIVEPYHLRKLNFYISEDGLRSEEIPPECAALRHGLDDIFDELPEHWRNAPVLPKNNQYRNWLFAFEFARCAGAIRHEFAWDCVMHEGKKLRSLPKFPKYIRSAKFSVGVPLTAALICTLEQDPQRVWKRGFPCSANGGRVVRLANDLNLFEKDQRSNHFNSIFIAGKASGANRKGSAEMTQEETLQARLVTRKRLDDAINDFGDTMYLLDDGPMSFVLRYSVAFALAVYGDGRDYTAK